MTRPRGRRQHQAGDDLIGSLPSVGLEPTILRFKIESATVDLRGRGTHHRRLPEEAIATVLVDGRERVICVLDALRCGLCVREVVIANSVHLFMKM
jgi:hypothetical protein